MKYYGNVCFTIEVEALTDDGRPTGNFMPEKHIYPYSGDVINLTNRRVPGEGTTNSDIEVSKRISIVGDPFAYQNFMNITYIEWMGAKWTVSSVDVQFPRLILEIGGLYNAN